MKTMIDTILDMNDSEREIEKILNKIGYEYRNPIIGFTDQSFSFYDVTYVILQFLEHIKEIENDNTESIPL